METELKFQTDDLEELAALLRRLGAAEVWPRHFERNLVFDDNQESLRGQGTLLRLRLAGDRASLTLKRKPQNTHPGHAKVMDERETEVADFDATRAILEGLGYRVAFAYEKYRREYRLGDCLACLDELPFGSYLELEAAGEGELIRCATALGLEPAEGIVANYHQLNLSEREKRGLPPGDGFVFDGWAEK
ncbi:class IV adenylate cyclase [Desulfohalovibrio reitneri]|uniref:class IV adenylate cyclase n=1 Tax=Desulfohalovibrio reitneri TaxID=1307759 RepID=UPI0004A6F955|nr:class IV adenylate cyclase [Desulfohalovibrio reitneri]